MFYLERHIGWFTTQEVPVKIYYRKIEEPRKVLKYDPSL